MDSLWPCWFWSHPALSGAWPTWRRRSLRSTWWLCTISWRLGRNSPLENWTWCPLVGRRRRASIRWTASHRIVSPPAPTSQNLPLQIIFFSPSHSHSYSLLRQAFHLIYCFCSISSFSTTRVVSLSTLWKLVPFSLCLLCCCTLISQPPQWPLLQISPASLFHPLASSPYVTACICTFFIWNPPIWLCFPRVTELSC